VEQDLREFDVLIAGGGLAGVLAAARLTASFPHIKVALLEKSPQVGGRLRSSLQVTGEWGYGLSLVGEPLYHYIQQSLTVNPHSSLDISAVIKRKQDACGFLSGGKLHTLLQKEVFSSTAAKILGGPAAANQWAGLWEIISNPEQANATLARQGKQLGKNPAATVLAQFAPFCGLADIWQAPMGALLDRSQAVAAGSYFGPWEVLLGELIASSDPQLSVFTSCQIASARLEESTWTVVSAQGTMKARWLLVAQPPWEAVEWLDKKSCHPWLWFLANQSKPTSAVVLVEKITNEGTAREIPCTFVPAEEALVYRLGDGCITSHTIIDYEQSLNSPAVVKAIKQLRRANAKYKKAFAGLETQGEYIALKSVAWPQTAYLRGQKLDYAHDAALRQSFCGDAYGTSFLPDENLIESVTNSGMQIGEFLQG
jgi:hypothetical protein